MNIIRNITLLFAFTAQALFLAAQCVQSVNFNTWSATGAFNSVWTVQAANTELLSGTINFREGKCYMTLTMNDVTKQIVTEYTFENKLFTLTSTLNVEEFGGEKAIAAINTACLELHKGKDGVSKTWNLVDIKGSVLFQ